MATPEGRTADGFEQQFGINFLAHFTLTNLLLPTLLKSTEPSFNSRVIAITSSAHRYTTVHLDDINLSNGYDPNVGYGQSKTANIWMANYIDRVFGPRGVRATSVHPGGVWTSLHDNLPEEVVEGWKADPIMSSGMLNPEQGAATTIVAATTKDWEAVGGKYHAQLRLGRTGQGADVDP